MKRPFGLLGPEFGPFLYASVGDEGNGMMLSVLSMLARRDLDPWTEAAALATLPVDAAARRLASLMTGLPGMAGRLGAGGAADRLVLLLPKPTRSIAPLSEAVVHNTPGMSKASIIIWIIVTGLIMGTQAIQASQQPHAPKQDMTNATASVPATKGLSPGSGQ